MLTGSWKKNDKRAYTIIIVISVVVFGAVSVLNTKPGDFKIGFDPHIFAEINAIINSIVAILLVSALIAVKQRKYVLHKRIMLTAILLSVIFLLSYICHHFFAGEARYGDVDHNGILSDAERGAAGNARIVYYCILGTHIPLAGIVLPFILLAAYRAMTGDYEKHKKLVRFTWPLWMYVALTGVIVYLMIKPYYN